jgi:hypothetical protein
MFNIESNNSQNGGLEDYNNISESFHVLFPLYKNNLSVDLPLF